MSLPAHHPAGRPADRSADRPADRADALRQRLIRLIHVARRELRLDEPTYRTVLQAAGGAESTTAMNPRQLQAVLDRLKQAGFKVRAPSGPQSSALTSSARAAPDRRQDTRREALKVRALWLFLHHLGAVRDPSERALAAYVRRIGKVDDMHWADGDRMLALIETLKKWAMRYLPAAVATLMAEVAEQHRRQPLDAEQAQDAERAHSLLTWQGFDAHWEAFELLHRVLGRPLPESTRGAR